jgi:hypothetical protein
MVQQGHLRTGMSGNSQILAGSKKPAIYTPQSDVFTAESLADVRGRFHSVKSWLFSGDSYGSSYTSHYIKVSSDIDKHVHLCEDILILLHDFINSTNLASRYVSVVSFCKRRGNRISFASTLLCLVADLFGCALIDSSPDKLEDEINRRIAYTAQAEEDDNIFAEARKYINCYEKLKETAIYKKLYKFLLYTLSLGLLDNVNITYDSLNFSKFEAKVSKETHRPGIDMAHCFLDTILFICDKGLQYFKTGNSDVIFHSGSSYDKWFVKANKLMRDAKFLNNPEALGISKFTFLSDLKDCIEKGTAIVKFTAGLDKHEKMYVNRTLNDLKLLEAEQITRKSAQMPRKDPFAVLIHGSSSICKSQLKQILFYHYGKYFGLPTTADYMYTRCPTDEYWSGFNSTQWCIVMDDIAFLKPNNEVDPTLKEMLQVKNSVPYTPPQASLEDKGRTPVRAELLIGTTNTKHLNLYAYFACPFAIARRMSYVITAKVKKDYVKHNFMADTEKIPITPDGEYMNIWDFEVAIPVPQCDIEVDNQQSKYVVKHVFTDINDLLAWYIGVAKEHEASQKKALAADDVMINVQICQTCYRTTKACVCYTEQAEDNVPLQPDVSFPRVVQTAPEEDLEAILLKDMPRLFKWQLFLYKMIILGVDNPDPEFIIEAFSFFFSNIWIFIIFFTVSLYRAPWLTLFIACTMLGLYKLYTKIWVILHIYYQYTGGLMWKYTLLFKLTNNSANTYRLIFRWAGERIKKQHFTNTSLLRFAAFISAPIILLTLRRFMSGPSKKATAQGSEGSIPFPHSNEKPTFYYHNTYHPTGIEISQASRCDQDNIVQKYVEKGTAKFIFQFPSRPGVFSASIGLNITGQLWLFNKHVVKENMGFYDIILDPCEQNVSRNIKKAMLCSNDVFAIPNTDLIILNVRALPPGNNIIKYFPLSTPISGRFSGVYNLITRQGERSKLQLSNVNYEPRRGCPVFGIAGYHARVPLPTSNGDCGAACVVSVNGFSLILGTHTAGSPDGGVFLQHVSQAMLNSAITRFRPQVESGTIPISAPGYVRKLVDVHPKCPIRFMQKGTAHVAGSFVGYRPNHKSRVKKTCICNYVVDHGYKDECGPPDMSWRPWNIALADMTQPNFSVNTNILDRCEDAFYSDIKDALGNKIKDLEVYTQEVALNGVDGIAFVDMINTSTSAGNPFKKSKKNFIELDENGKISKVDMIIQQRIDMILKTYEQAKRFHPQFCGHLKDEPTLMRKILLFKTRLFSGGEFAWSVVVRRYLLSHIRLIQNNPFIFEAMPGVVAQSKEWQELWNYVCAHGSHKIIAGDYGKFDKRMIAAFINAAFNILIRLAQDAGWSQEDIIILRCISMDTAFPWIDFNGDLFEIQGNPSGHPLTVIINCLVNSLYMRYAFCFISKRPVEHFRKYINLATYGDDNIMGVSDDCPEFNHSRISTALKLIGVDYTMADKEAESRPYVHINETTFLKRSFRFDDDIGAIVAPLDHSSIDKMLTSRLDEDNIAPEAHAVCVIETALREYFYYGKETFLQKMVFFKQLVQDCNLTDWVEKSTFPSYDTLTIDHHDRLKYQPSRELVLWSGRLARE